MNKQTISVALATYNEEKNLEGCLESVKGLADEICIVDGASSDRTVKIAEKYGSKIKVTDNPPVFHINKQMAIGMATGDWILQLDADERVSPGLADEIKSVIEMDEEEIGKFQGRLAKRELFTRHQQLLEKRDGRIGTDTGEYAAFFIPRKNYFLGRYLQYGGVYPDGVIRLLKNGKAHFPAKNVHEQITVNGKVGWLQNDLLHLDSPTFGKYLKRWNRYTRLMGDELRKKKIKFNPFTAIEYLAILPLWWFVKTYGRHKGFLDGWQGFIFSLFSALRFPVAYIKAIKHTPSPR